MGRGGSDPPPVLGTPIQPWVIFFAAVVGVSVLSPLPSPAAPCLPQRRVLAWMSVKSTQMFWLGSLGARELSRASTDGR